MITDIIFDLGGVLIDWNPRYLYRKIFRDEARMEWFLSHICTGEWNAQQDAGRPLQEATELLSATYPEYQNEINAYYGRWTEMLNGAIQGTVTILQALAQGGHYPLYALTNWSHETFPYAYRNYSFLQYFKDIVVSGEEKTKKPEPEIYQILIERCGLDPAQSLFIDDSHSNIRTAEQIGFHTIHFQSSDQCKAEMEKMGIL